MDAARYWAALLMVALVPGVVLYWFSIHPFVRFWRKVGAWPAVVINVAFILLVAAAVFKLRGPLLATNFGANPILIALAIPVFLISGALRLQVAKQLANRTLMGFPELDPRAGAGTLLTEGIYARVRHPRYLQMSLGLMAFVLFANYLAAWILFVLFVAALFPLTWIEERELRERFGREYEAYRARTPRFIPKLRL